MIIDLNVSAFSSFFFFLIKQTFTRLTIKSPVKEYRTPSGFKIVYSYGDLSAEGVCGCFNNIPFFFVPLMYRFKQVKIQPYSFPHLNSIYKFLIILSLFNQ